MNLRFKIYVQGSIFVAQKQKIVGQKKGGDGIFTLNANPITTY